MYQKLVFAYESGNLRAILYVWTDYTKMHVFRNVTTVVKTPNNHIRRPWRQLIEKRQRHMEAYANRHRDWDTLQKQSISPATVKIHQEVL